MLSFVKLTTALSLVSSFVSFAVSSAVPRDVSLVDRDVCAQVCSSYVTVHVIVSTVVISQFFEQNEVIYFGNGQFFNVTNAPITISTSITVTTTSTDTSTTTSALSSSSSATTTGGAQPTTSQIVITIQALGPQRVVKRQDALGLLSNGDKVDTCSNASIYTVFPDARIADAVGFISTDLIADVALFKGSSDSGGHSAGFQLSQNRLDWVDEDFDGGAARFALDTTGVYAVFRGAIPAGSTQIVLGIADDDCFRQAQAAASGSSSIVPTSTNNQPTSGRSPTTTGVTSQSNTGSASQSNTGSASQSNTGSVTQSNTGSQTGSSSVSITSSATRSQSAVTSSTGTHSDSFPSSDASSSRTAQPTQSTDSSVNPTQSSQTHGSAQTSSNVQPITSATDDAVAAATSIIESLHLQPFCSSYLGYSAIGTVTFPDVLTRTTSVANGFSLVTASQGSTVTVPVSTKTDYTGVQSVVTETFTTTRSTVDFALTTTYTGYITEGGVAKRATPTAVEWGYMRARQAAAASNSTGSNAAAVAAESPSTTSSSSSSSAPAIASYADPAPAISSTTSSTSSGSSSSTTSGSVSTSSSSTSSLSSVSLPAALATFPPSTISAACSLEATSPTGTAATVYYSTTTETDYYISAISTSFIPYTSIIHSGTSTISTASPVSTYTSTVDEWTTVAWSTVCLGQYGAVESEVAAIAQSDAATRQDCENYCVAYSGCQSYAYMPDANSCYYYDGTVASEWNGVRSDDAGSLFDIGLCPAGSNEAPYTDGGDAVIV